MPQKHREKISVIGSGRWGTAMANAFSEIGSTVRLWGRDRSVSVSINKSHENRKYFPGCKLNETVRGETDLELALSEADYIVCAIPTQLIRSVISPHKKLLEGKCIINTSKGIEEKSQKLIHEIFSELAPKSPYVVLSGPSFAEEVLSKLPTAVSVASENPDWASKTQELVSSRYFRAYTSSDVVGVEMGGALKNVVAIAAGISTGLGFGHNSQAAIINRGLGEIVRLGKKKGAEPLTFLGLSGMGDLILTCTGSLSRNRKLGIAFGEGKTLEEVKNSLGGIAEGYFTCRAAMELTKTYSLELPITHQVYRILYEGQKPETSLRELMGRELKEEWEF